MGNLQQVKEFSRREMPQKPFHNFGHVKRVSKVAPRLGSETELLEVAAYLHDIAPRTGSEGHEERSARIAGQKLPEWGYTQQETNKVAQAIRDTELFKSPESTMGKALSDADTHNFGLGFEKFKSISLQVKKEEALEATEEEWWDSVIGLLQNHSYHGPGRGKFGQQKQHNREKLEEMVQDD